MINEPGSLGQQVAGTPTSRRWWCRRSRTSRSTSRVSLVSDSRRNALSFVDVITALPQAQEDGDGG